MGKQMELFDDMDVRPRYVRNGIYYKRSTNEFIAYSQGSVSYRIDADRMSADQKFKDKIKRDRSIP